MFEVCILIGLFQLIDADIAYEIAIWNITAGNWLYAGSDLSCRTVVYASFDSDNRYIVGVENEKTFWTAEKFEIYIDVYIYIYLLSF